jgi:hypothetical protein
MTIDTKAIYKALAAPFADEAVERTRGDVTRRGYDTTGIKYQYVVNRLNEVLGVGGFRVERQFSVREKEARSGQPMFDVTCDLTMWLGTWEAGQFVPFAEAQGTGGHVAASEADAKKGAFTNGFKKTAAFFGVGRQAYEGTLDDDNVPADGAPPPPPPPEVVPATGGRVTQAQLAKLRAIVDERGIVWAEFRDQVREDRGVTPEFLSRRAASDLISQLIARQRGAA